MSSQLQVSGEAKIRDIQGPVVANSGVITALDGAASQYVRGDGTLADFPTSSGGGSSVSYYLNSSVSQGTIGGVAYRELSKEPIIGAGTDIAISTTGYVASYLTDANDPDVISIPGGNFNCEFYFSVNNNTGNPFFYAELYKYDGTTFTLIGSSVGVPEYITQGTVINPYYFAIPVPTSALALTDRLAIRIYVNVDGRTVTLHTENGHLCQVVTTLSKGMVSLNNLTDQSQFITTGTSGTNFAIVSSGDTHTFNLPVASATNTGKLSSSDWSVFNAKQAALSFTAPLVNTSNTISIPAATSLVDGYLDNLDWVKFNTAYNDSIISAAVTGTTTKTLTLNQQDGGTITASWTDDNTDAVTSVFGRTGAVVAVSGDYNTSQVTELTNLYFTDARSRAALSFVAGSGAYNSTTGVITIPTNNNQITNGSNFITLTSLSAGAGISYNNTTGAISSTITQYTDALARASISLTTTGTSGAATYNSTTGILNVPNYGSALSGYLPLTGGTLSTTNSTETLRINNSGSGYSLYVQTNSYFQGDLTLQGSLKSAFHTFILPNASGTLALTSQIPSLTGYVQGSGTTNYLPKFTGASTIGNSAIYDNSGNIGIGIATSSTTLELFSTTEANLKFQSSGAGGDQAAIYVQKGTGNGVVFAEENRDFIWRTGAAALTGGGGTQVMRLTNGGNLGLGVTPSADWNTSNSRALQINDATGGNTGSFHSVGGTVGINSNSYFGSIGGASWKYYGTGAAAIYWQETGSHRWGIAGSGTAGNAISFTQAMTLDANGRLGIGTPSAGYTLDIYKSGGALRIYDISNPSALATYSKDLGAIITSYYSASGSPFTRTMDIVSNADAGAESQMRFLTATSGGNPAVALTLASSGAATFSSSVTASKGTFNGSTSEPITFERIISGSSIRRYSLAISGAGNFSLYDATADADRFIIASNGAATFSSSVTAQSGTFITSGNYTNLLIGTTSTTGTIIADANRTNLVLGAVTSNKIVFNNASSTQNGYVYSDAAELSLGYPASGTFNIQRVGVGNVLTVNSSGSVGIGTSSPFAIADINTSINGSGSSALQLGVGGTRTGQFFASSTEVRIGSVTNVPLRFYANDAESMRIFSDGNVGINTGATNAGYKLDVNGTGRFSGKVITTGPANDWGLVVNGSSTVGQSYGANIRGGSNSSDVSFLVSNYVGTDILRIRGDGAATFSSSVTAAGGFFNGNGSFTNNGFWGTLLTAGTGSYSDFAIIDNTSTQIMRVPTGTRNVVFSSSVTATSFFESSDSRLKIIVKDYEQPKGIENVAARMYVKNSKQELGYFAQDLQEILPSAVNEGEDGYLNLSYSQVHTAKIAYLEEKVAQLEELIKSLKIN